MPRFRLPLWMRVSLFVLLGLGLFLGFNLWRRGVAQAPVLQPLPQDPLIQVYFNQSQAARYWEPYRKKERLGDNLEQIVIDGVRAAQTSVDVAVQELRLPGIAKALADKQRAGVRVRVILENTYNRSPQPQPSMQGEEVDERSQAHYQEYLMLVDQNQDGRLDAQELAENDALVILKNAGVPLLDDQADGSRGSGLMHHKFVVIDGQRVLTGSVNFSHSDMHGDFASPESRGNANHLLKISSPVLADLFTEEFNLMWGDGPNKSLDSRFGLQKPARPAMMVRLGANSAIALQFSPTSPKSAWQFSTNGLIGQMLNTAQRTIDEALFVFSEQPLADILQTLHQKGVRVRALIEPSFAFRSYSEGLDMLGVQLPDQKCRYEPGNQPWRQPLTTVGTPELPEGDLLHHKFAVVDGHTVITGSHNWSAAANHSNDEALLVIQNATVAAHFNREFERLYGTATLGVPTWLQEKIRTAASKCGL